MVDNGKGSVETCDECFALVLYEYRMEHSGWHDVIKAKTTIDQDTIDEMVSESSSNLLRMR